jgi:hypothetical protein
MTDEPKKPAWVRCDRCDHHFTYAYLPMEADKAVTLMRRLSCPMCANVDSNKFYFCEAPFLEGKEND